MVGWHHHHRHPRGSELFDFIVTTGWHLGCSSSSSFRVLTDTSVERTADAPLTRSHACRCGPHCSFRMRLPMDPRHVRLPPPPTEAQRAQLGTVSVMAGRAGTVPIFTAPAKGAGAGALRGAGLGSGLTIAGGAVAGPYGVLLGILLAPVGAVVGSVVGAANAEPAAQVEEKEAAIRKTMEELKIQETLRGCV